MTQVVIADTLVFHIKKAGRSFDVPVSTYSADVTASIFEIGLGRVLNDLVASAKTEAEAQAAVGKKLDAWERGEVRAARESDPVAQMARNMALKAIQADPDFRAWVVKHGGGKPTTPESVKELAERVKVLAAREDVVAKAQAAVELIAGIQVTL